jgi:hypothetical protein
MIDSHSVYVSSINDENLIRYVVLAPTYHCDLFLSLVMYLSTATYNEVILQHVLEILFCMANFYLPRSNHSQYVHLA